MTTLDEVVALQRHGSSRDEILKVLKARGLTITEAIKTSMQLFGLGLGDAKTLVTTHPSWIQTAEAARPLHEILSNDGSIVVVRGPYGVGGGPAGPEIAPGMRCGVCGLPYFNGSRCISCGNQDD